MLDHKILSACASNRDWFNKTNLYLDMNTMPAIGKAVFKEISNFYSIDSDADKVDVALIGERLVKSLPKQKESVIEYIANIGTNVSDANVIELIIDQHKEKLSHDMAIAAGTGDLVKLAKLVEQYSKASTLVEDGEEAVVYTAPNIGELTETLLSDNLIPIYPKKLNDLLGGGVTRQSQVGVVARPDIGKSTVTINIAVQACIEGYKVVFFGNEDPDSVMILRAYTRFLKASRDKILSNPNGAYNAAMKRGLSNFTFISLSPGTMVEIEQHVKELKPDVIIVDQLRNMRVGSKDTGLTEALNTLAKEGRTLAKKYNLVSIVVTQAGDSASGKLILDYTDVEYSNTGFAAQLDLMIGVGQNATLKDIGRAMLAFPKNKLTAPLAPFEVMMKYDTNEVLTSE